MKIFPFNKKERVPYAELPFKKRALLTLGRFLIPIVILAMVLVFSVSMLLKLITKDLIVDTALSTVAFKGITAQEIEEGSTADAKIAEMIARGIRERYDYKVSTEQVIKIMNSIDVSGFLKETLDEFVDEFYNTGKLPVIDADEYVDLIEENKDIIEYAIDHKLPSSYYKYQIMVVKKVNSYNKKAESFNEKYKTLLKMQRIMSSTAALTAIAGLCIILMLAYSFMRRRIGLKLYTTFRIYTFVFIITSRLIFILRSYITTEIVKPDTLSGAILNKIMSNVSDYVGYSTLGVGIAFAILWIIFALPHFTRKKA